MLLALLVAFSALADETVAPPPAPLPDYLVLATQDETSRALLEKAMGKLGLKSFEELAKFVSACTPEQLSSKTQHGLAIGLWRNTIQYATEDDLRSGKAPEEYFRDRIEQDKRDQKAYATRISRIEPDYVSLRHWVDPGLCLKNGISMLDQYDAFIHELTHLIETDYTQGEDMLAFKDVEDYALKTILAPGGEVDAFLAGTSARLRTLHAIQEVSPPLRPFFDENGNFNGDREGFARAILEPRGVGGGMGYLDRHFRERYARRLAKNLESEIYFRNGLARLAEVRQLNGSKAAYERLLKDIAERDERIRRLQERVNPPAPAEPSVSVPPVSVP
jgi:hypothetical protein